jgi:hypothetical protein
MRRGGGLLFSSLFLTASFVVACSSASGSNNNGGGGSGNGGSGGINVGGSGAISVGGNGGTGALTGCNSQVYDGELVPLDMFLMLDKSGSMQDSSKWSAVTGAITQFMQPITTSDKLGMGLGLFPTPASGPIPSACTTNQECGFYGPCVPVFNQCNGALAGNDSCVATDYQTPVVPIAELPGVSSQISGAISSASPDGASTPAGPALEGAIDYATIWAQGHPDRMTVVVLATDGDPTNCTPNTVADVAAHAAEGLNQSPSIKTFVIGVGSELTSLNQIAQSGGTDQATLVSTANAGAEFKAALDKIRGAVVCQYLVPQDGKSDPTKVNILFTPDGQTDGEIIPGVSGLSACQGNKGWYYDNPSNPTQILLCPAACDMVKNVKGKVEVVFGCQTVVN